MCCSLFTFVCLLNDFSTKGKSKNKINKTLNGIPSAGDLYLVINRDSLGIGRVRLTQYIIFQMTCSEGLGVKDDSGMNIWILFLII